jgi:hypothetical protein
VHLAYSEKNREWVGTLVTNGAEQQSAPAYVYHSAIVSCS